MLVERGLAVGGEVGASKARVISGLRLKAAADPLRQ